MNTNPLQLKNESQDVIPESLQSLLSSVAHKGDPIEDEENEDDEDEDEPSNPQPKEEPKEEPIKEDEEENEDDEEEETDEEPQENIITELASEFGDVDFGEETEFETEADAIKVYINKLIEKERSGTQSKAVEDLFKSQPVLKALHDHLSQGFGLESFLQEQEVTNFQSIDIDEATEDQQEEILRAYYRSRDIDNEEIDETLENLRDTGKLAIRAKTAHEKLVKAEQEEIKAQKQKEKEDHDTAVAKANKTREELNTILQSGKVTDSIVLSKEKTKILKDFIEGQTKEGASLRNETWKNLPLNKLVLLDYLVATDFKDLNFTENTVKAKLTKNIKIKSVKSSKDSTPTTRSSGVNIKSLFNQ